ncbi:MAG: MBL fold metallo-hydrolase RNA specificity domain-containing protein [Bacteroidota bacterium]
MKISFFGATQTVTGSKHIITTNGGKNLLLDCGLFQGRGAETESLNRHFGFEPSTINYMILSHAHADHAGNIPQLVKSGFSGPIFATPATIDLCKIMLADSAHIQEYDVQYLNKRRARKHQELLKPIYTLEDVQTALKQFIPVRLHELTKIDSELSFHFSEAGHILGSACVNVLVNEERKIKKVFFSGDVGRYNDKILKAPEDFPQSDVIIMETTYGNRLHEHTNDAEDRLLKVVIDTCVNRKGKVIIPAFSLGRTQEIIYALDRAHTEGKMPHVPVYIDSPLSISATEIMKKHTESFNPEILEYMVKDENPFGYDEVTFIRDVEDSKALNESDEPCIIISASGMMEAGRVKHHIKNNIENAKNTILIVGYVTPNSLGGKLKEGAPQVKIFGDLYNVHAKVEVIDSYSAHADADELIQFITCQNPKLTQNIFLVHGEMEAATTFKERLIDLGFSNIEIPESGAVFHV